MSIHNVYFWGCVQSFLTFVEISEILENSPYLGKRWFFEGGWPLARGGWFLHSKSHSVFKGTENNITGE